MIRACFLLPLLHLTVCPLLPVSAFPVVHPSTTSRSLPTHVTTAVSIKREHPCSPVFFFCGGLRLSSRDDETDDVDELARVPRRRRRGRFYDEKEEEDAFYDAVERRIYGEKEKLDEDDNWDEEEEEDEDEDLGLFSNVLIDNPILDSIDPDGAAERFPELARDPRFWFDMILFITFLDLISAIGPQNTFPDIPFYV